MWTPNPELYKIYLQARVREGRGIGSCMDYQSFLDEHDFPSYGTMVQVKGLLIPRVYILFSTEYEQTCFYLWERKPTTIDIRENFPIFDIDFTLELCARSGIQHTYRDGFPSPFTIDLVVTEFVDGIPQDRALEVKTPEDAKDEETRQRLRVGRVWCRDRAEIPWLLVDTSGFTKELLSTLLFMRAWRLHGYKPNSDREALFLDYFLSRYTRNTPLRELILRSAKVLRMSEGKRRYFPISCLDEPHSSVAET